MALNLRALLPWQRHPEVTNPVKDMMVESAETQGQLTDHSSVAKHYDSPIDKEESSEDRQQKSKTRIANLKKLNILSAK